ncbi:hypothetical protein MUK42_07050 [Musa troglodytarum]|uniref:Uncharacterized protein n=1 Tax=Musa troglodytarum TaxID=320322 RepID=A0A9E7K979_9LILI|nr:hypothetical protein MUK42_07050 [Musa troglodytarum]
MRARDLPLADLFHQAILFNRRPFLLPSPNLSTVGKVQSKPSSSAGNASSFGVKPSSSSRTPGTVHLGSRALSASLSIDRPPSAPLVEANGPGAGGRGRDFCGCGFSGGACCWFFLSCGGPSSLRGQFLHVFPWRPKFNPLTETLKSSPVWIHLPKECGSELPLSVFTVGASAISLRVAALSWRIGSPVLRQWLACLATEVPPLGERCTIDPWTRHEPTGGPGFVLRGRRSFRCQSDASLSCET